MRMQVAMAYNSDLNIQRLKCSHHLMEEFELTIAAIHLRSFVVFAAIATSFSPNAAMIAFSRSKSNTAANSGIA